MTLDQLEFDKLIGRTKDPRIHFVLGCAARSCPYLEDYAYRPGILEEQLENRAKLILLAANYVYVDQGKNQVLLNKIFEWYQDQFEEEAGSLLQYINRYRANEVPQEYDIKFQEYDWSLNDQ